MSYEIEQLTEPVAVYIGRQPILDRAGALVAYELLFRRGETNAAGTVGDTEATGQVIANAIGEFGIQKVLGNQRGFVNIGAELLADDVLGLLSPPDTFVLEILETIPRDDVLETQCKRLRQAGFGLALDDVVTLDEMPERIVKLVDVVKIDFPRVEMRALPHLVKMAHRSGAKVLAEKVETAQQYRELHALGVDMFQGYFFAHPEMLKQRKLTYSIGDLMNIMNALSADSPIDKLEPIIKRNPPLLMHLMKLASSGHFGNSKPVSTISEAIYRVGTRTLARWTQLLIYAGMSEVPLRNNALVQLIATRARFLELAADLTSTGRDNDTSLSDKAYQVGIFSLMHLLLDMSAQELMEQLTVAPDVRDAVIHRRGTLGGLLALAEMVESGKEGNLDSMLSWADEGAAQEVSDITAEAAAWAVAEFGV